MKTKAFLSMVYQAFHDLTDAALSDMQSPERSIVVLTSKHTMPSVWKDLCA